MALNPNEQAFFRAMEAVHTDDTPRLVYADWLEERGDVDRATFIRLQIEASRCGSDPGRKHLLEKQADQLLRKHYRRWTAGLPEWAMQGWEKKKWHFTRGFPDVEWQTGRQFLGDAGMLRERMPLGQIWFTSLGRTAPRVFTSEHFGALRLVHLCGTRLVDGDVAVLAASPQARQLIVLWLSRRWTSTPAQANRLTDTAAAALARSPNLPALKFLSLASYRTVTVAGLRTIIESKRLANLQTLELEGGSQCPGSPDLGTAFASKRCQLRNLRSLNLSRRKLGDEGVIALAKSPHFQHLESLDISDNGLTDAAVVALVRSPGLRSLRRLTINGDSRLTDVSAHAILADGRDWDHVKIDSHRMSVPMSQAIRFKLGPASPQEMR
ncbi:TIGR02996 domain-containing protein [Limnoglobus roseus]|uniref:TIGR02996 domain-containing protein n=1 Tax=Limnoglobus roseus TaxID=2598579 RepID=A0A5C1APG5_9BACT|nr:TIGR02996 domain-containing protein [Limnoglobus roseus]QEL21061.1 TIGR02996 domain-containing protein [Limnoglobus roseus]